MENEVLALNGLSIEILNELSFPSALGISLKKTLRHFDKDELMRELASMTDWLDMQESLADIPLDYRIKSLASIRMKYDRYNDSSRYVNQAYNDILGFRAFCNQYDDVLAMRAEQFSIADLSHGKSQDDGYRGVHLYFQRDNFHYPIEIQFNTLYDRQLNNWLHDYLYKRPYDSAVGKTVRQYYESGQIRTESEFREVLNHVLSGR